MPVDLNDRKLPQEILEGLYNPSFLPDDLRLNEFLSDPDKERKRLQEKVQAKVDVANAAHPTGGTANGTPVPLTREEAEEVDRKIENLRGRIGTLRNTIKDLRASIDEAASPKDGKELSFKVDLTKKPRVRRAIQIVFGVKTDTLTYSMYKQALELKRKLERDEVDAYLKG